MREIWSCSFSFNSSSRNRAISLFTKKFVTLNFVLNRKVFERLVLKLALSDKKETLEKNNRLRLMPDGQKEQEC